MFKHILVPTDGSDLSTAAVHKAVGFAAEVGAKLTFLHVIPDAPFATSSFGEDARYEPDIPKRFIEAAKERARQILDAVMQIAAQAGVAAEPVIDTSDAPHAIIIKTAEDHGCDLIFMASHGRRGINALLIGSETQKVLTHCSIPVLVCR